jgi:hypothetical protein
VAATGGGHAVPRPGDPAAEGALGTVAVVPSVTTLRRVTPLCVAALLLLLAACGDGEAEAAGRETASRRSTTSEASTTSTSAPTTTAAPAPTTTAPAPPPPPTGGAGAPTQGTSLTVDVTAEGQAIRSGTVECAASGASGTGHLADPAAAQAACTLLRDNPGARNRLVNGVDPNRMCTQIYGGPDEARVQGQLDGQPVDTVVDRRDGCAMAEWDILVPLVGPAGG